ncbi:amino acid adenylation domain-containing protein, partial [Lysobacter pythonis]
MTALEILECARRAGIVLHVENGRLGYKATRAPLDDELRSAIGACRTELIALLSAADQGADDWRIQPIATSALDEAAPLSLAQERLWFLEQFEPGSTAYHLSALFELHGPLDADALERAVTGLLARHQVLDRRLLDGRTAVATETPFALERIELRDEAKARMAVAAFQRQPFALDRERPLRVQLVARGEAHAWLQVVVHHIACDGVSLAVLTRELSALYRAECTGAPAILAPLPCQYGDYARWQRDTLDRHVTAEAFWRQTLMDAPRLHGLLLDRERPAQLGLAGAKWRLPFPTGLAERVSDYARGCRATPFHVLHAAYVALLARFGAGDDLLVGTPVAGRTRAEFEPLVGLFVNTVVLRTQLHDDPDFATLVMRCRDQQLAALEHQDLPLERVLELLEVERSSRHAPLFQLMFALRHDADIVLDLDGVQACSLPVPDEVAKHELTLEVLIGEDDMSAVWEYNTALFDQAMIERLAAHYFEALDAMLDAPAQPALAWPLPAEQTALDDRRVEGHASSSTVLETIAEVARRHPDRVALEAVHPLRYDELMRAAHARGQWLQRHSSSSAARVVALCLPRCVDWYATWLGAWLVGYTVVPLDPDWPEARTRAIVADSGAALVVTTAALLSRFDAGTAVAVDDARFTGPGEVDAVAHCKGNIAYLLYTSGSTGAAKGVAVSHAALAEHIATISQTLHLHAEDRVLHLTNPAVDTTLEQMLAAWSVGACVVAQTGDLPEPERFLDVATAEQITVTDLAPAYANAVVAATTARDWNTTALRCIVVGGDVLPLTLARRWRELGLNERCELINAYGPTEAVITSHMHPVGQESGPIPLGRVLPGRLAMVLDAHGRLAPRNVPGELALGGVLADGYHALPALTEERFVTLALPSGERARVYRSGDRVRLSADEQLDFIGRDDFQIKLRGYRIELEEVEKHLMDLPGVAAVAAGVVGQGAEQRLVAWLEASQNEETVWRRLLAAQLPTHMVPTQFIVLKPLPRNAAGKIDRHALPEPAPIAADVFIEPRSDAERAVATVWAEVLQRPVVGLHDNFFRLGGDSIRSLQVIARLRERGYEVTPKLMFEYQTVAELAGQLASTQAKAPEIAPLHGVVPLSPIQRWFFAAHSRQPDLYHQYLVLRLKQPANPAHLARVWDRLWQRHDLLRASFQREGDDWCQSVAAPGPAPAVVRFDWRGRGDADALVPGALEVLQRQTPLRGPLAVVALAQCDDGERLLVCAHHLIIDGVSWRLLIGELFDGLAAFARGEDWQPGARTATYADYVAALTHAADAGDFDADFWREVDGESATWLPQDRVIALSEARQGNVERRMQRFDATLTAELLERAGTAYRCHTDELLLIALARALSAQAGKLRVRIDRERHGRDVLAERDWSSVLGWFTAVHPLPLMLSGGTLADDIVALKEQIRAVQQRGLEYLPLCAAGHLTEQPPGQVLFNYHGVVDTGGHPGFELDAQALPSSNGADNPPDVLLEINARVVGARLELAWNYAGEAFDASTIQRWADAFADELKNLIAHCLRPGQGRLTPSDLPQMRLPGHEFTVLAARADGQAIERAFPLTPLQRGVLVESLRRSGRDPYFQQTVAELEGDVDVNALARGWQATVACQPMLRTAMLWEGISLPHQLVITKATAPWQVIDWSALEDGAQEAALRAWLEEDQARSVDLAEPPLARMCLFVRGKGRYWLVWSIHHLIVDGWSTPLLVSQILEHYRTAARGAVPKVAPAPDFARYLAWRDRQDLSAQREWWRERLAGYQGAVALPSPEQPDTPGRREECVFALSDADSAQVRTFCREHGCTLSELLSLAWGLAVARYGNSDDVVLGVTRSGRPADLPGVESMVGVFINTLPLRLRIDPEKSASDWLAKLREQMVEIAANDVVALADVLQDSGLSAEQAFSSLLVVENFPAMDMADLPFRLHVRETRSANHYALTLRVSDRQQLRLEALLDASRIAPEATAAMLEFTALTLLHVVETPECRVADLLRTDAAIDTAAPPPIVTAPAATLLWSQPADALAVLEGDRASTYGELHAAAASLAAVLDRAGVLPVRTSRC